MDRPAPSGIKPVRVAPEEDRQGGEGRADQNLLKQRPSPESSGIHFETPPPCKETLATALPFCSPRIDGPAAPSVSPSAFIEAAIGGTFRGPRAAARPTCGLGW